MERNNVSHIRYITLSTYRRIIARRNRRLREQRFWKIYLKAMRRALKKSKALSSKATEKIY
jgi:hypothetical protein